MGKTIVERIIEAHCGHAVRPGDIADVAIDARLARDFGGANVVQNLERAHLGVHDPTRTAFTFDCNPTGSDQLYAANQQRCRLFARQWGIRIFDINAGIGTHLALEEGLVTPGGTLVSTDSHANILGAIGAFGQGMGDQDIAHAFAHGKVWFKVPPTVRVLFKGKPGPHATAKDLALALLRVTGASGLLGVAAEIHGEAIDALDLWGRITLASMATEMGGIIALVPPNERVMAQLESLNGLAAQAMEADPDATVAATIEVDVGDLPPLASRPGKPHDVAMVRDLGGRKIDSVFIGSCTNGRLEDLEQAARIIKGRHVAPGVVLKIVPATDRVWKDALEGGLMALFKEAGALVGNAGCAGCAAGQIGQNGPGEVTVSTGNRNFPGKQGKGEVYLASPATAAASAVAGALVAEDAIPARPLVFDLGARPKEASPRADGPAPAPKPTRLKGRLWLVDRDDIDTDMIFHNRHLAITRREEMGPHTFGNLQGYEDFARRVRPGDMVATGSNFGCGSSRQQAVDCFAALGVTLLIARSFGAIFERNAINSAMPLMTADLLASGLQDGDTIEVDLATGTIVGPHNITLQASPLSPVQMTIYQRGGLL